MHKCVRLCVETALGVVNHPDYLHDSTELWNFKEHVCSGGGGGGFINLCQAVTASKWMASGWWRGGLRARSHTGFSLPFHTNALIDWCGSTGNAASVWTVEMSYAEALRHQGLPLKSCLQPPPWLFLCRRALVGHLFIVDFSTEAAGSKIKHADFVPGSTLSSGLHGFWIHKRLCRFCGIALFTKFYTPLTSWACLDTNKSAAFSALVKEIVHPEMKILSALIVLFQTCMLLPWNTKQKIKETQNKQTA